MKYTATLLLLPMLLASQARAEEPRPPRVVLLGDSIRLSYVATVSRRLEGQVVLISPQANGGDSSNVLKHVEEWVIREKPDLVHFNCGIHDTKKFLTTGKFQVSPEQYEANLRLFVQRVRNETEAVVVFATTTPILDERAAKARQGRDYELLNQSIEQYNAIARKVMQELKVPVNDLNARLARPEPPQQLETLISADGVHLSPAGQKLLGEQVADVIRNHLPKTTP